MKEYKIPNPITLKFDPKKLDKGSLVNKIFEDDIARVLWMGIKCGHIVDQYFDGQCLTCTNEIRERGLPISQDDLRKMVNTRIGNWSSPYFSPEVISELLPYINGEKRLAYKVIS